MKQSERRHFSRTRISALGILAVAAMAQAAITASVTISSSSYAAYASSNSTPGEIIFFHATKANAGNDYDGVAGRASIRAAGTYTVNLGSTAGYFTASFSDSIKAAQASSCSTSPLTFGTSSAYTSSGTINVTITCTEVDYTGPTFSSAVLSSTGTTLTITFNENVDMESSASTSAFTVTAGGASVGVSNVGYSGSTVILTLASAITSGKTVLVSYAGGGIYDDEDNDASTFANKAVTNNSAIVPAAPTVKTGSASSITSSSATLAGTVTANNATTADSIQYGTSTSYGTTVVASPATTTGASATSITASLSGLAPNTTYHYRVKAVNSVGPTNGSDATFTTLAIVPTAATGSASSITSSSATLTGTVNANNASTVVTFDYGTTSNYESSLTAAQSPVTGMAATAVSGQLPNLLPNTTYHYRVKAVNTAGTTNGADITFTTSTIAPTATTGSASSITSSSATLAGTVNANNTTAYDSIQYGTSTSYGTTVAASPATTTGASATSITASLSGLAPNTTYHYRVKAVNSVGPTNGADSTFTTLAIVPTVKTGSASAVTSSSATLAGTVNANNASAVVTFEYGTAASYGSSFTAAQSPVTGMATTAVSGLLPNLLPNTTYHYRVTATNTAGTTNGTDATFTTSKLTQTIAASQATSGSYGDTVSLSATATSGLSVTWASTDTSAVKIVSESKAVLRKVGKATVLASQLGNTSYDSAASVLCTLTVGRKALHIAGMTAADKIYDGTATATVSGGHLDSVLAGDSVILVPGTANFASKNVGTTLSVSLADYAIAGRDSASYELHTANQTAIAASILAKKLLVTALDTAKMFGASDPVLAYKDTGLVAGDNLTGALVRSTGDTVGSYAIGQGTLTAGSNYDLVFVPATFTIKPNPVTGIEGGAPVHLRTLGTLGLSTLKKLPAMASGSAHPELGLGKLDGETQRLSLLLPAPATISIDIFDLLGVPVISWSTKIDEATWKGLDETEGGRTATVSWNLRAANGTAVPAGVYLWKIKATTVDGQQLETVKRMGIK